MHSCFPGRRAGRQNRTLFVAQEVARHRTKVTCAAAMSTVTVVRHLNERKVDAAVTLLVDAYPVDSPYRIQPKDQDAFRNLVMDTEEYLLLGVPDTTSANERSAINRYWRPFCMHIGCSATRPPSSECTPVQQRAEDSLKALALPYIYWTMKGRKPNKKLQKLHMCVYTYLHIE